MARVTIDDSILYDTADSIRKKKETSASISPLNFATMIDSISGGGELPDNMVIGEFTPEENLDQITISYKRDTAPVMAICFLKEQPTEGKAYLQVCSVAVNFDDAIKSTMNYYSYNGTSIGGFASNYVSVSEMTNEHTTFLARGGNYLMKAGFTYCCIIAF